MRRNERDQLDAQWDALAARLAADPTPDAALGSLEHLVHLPFSASGQVAGPRVRQQGAWRWQLGGRSLLRAGNLVGLTALTIALIAGAVLALPAAQRSSTPTSG